MDLPNEMKLKRFIPSYHHDVKGKSMKLELNIKNTSTNISTNISTNMPTINTTSTSSNNIPVVCKLDEQLTLSMSQFEILETIAKQKCVFFTGPAGCGKVSIYTYISFYCVVTYLI